MNLGKKSRKVTQETATGIDIAEGNINYFNTFLSDNDTNHQEESKYLDLIISISKASNKKIDLCKIARLIKNKLKLNYAFLLIFKKSYTQKSKIQNKLSTNEISKLLSFYKEENAISDSSEKPGIFIRKLIKKQKDLIFYTSPLITSKDSIFGILLYKSKCSKEEELYIHKFSGLLSIFLEKQININILELKARLDHGRANFSGKLFKCTMESEVLKISLAYFKKCYGIRSGTFLIAKKDSLVLKATRLRAKTKEEKSIRESIINNIY